jgi:hypothetical protein
LYQELQNQWSGIWLYNDTNGDGVADFTSNEITHSFIPNAVGNIAFTTPGVAFNNTDAIGNLVLYGDDPRFNTTMDFGVQFLNVTGTTYPVIRDAFGSYGSYWDWQTTGLTGTDYAGFANRPTNVEVDEIAFQLHFDVVSILGQPNANATLKLDQTVGNWFTDITGGRDNFENYSMAISYFVQVNAAYAYQVATGTGQAVNNNQVVVSDSFTFGGNGAEFASAILKGTYVWAKNTTGVYNSTSYTMPLGQFQAFYQSDDGNTSVGFGISSTMFFLAIGFPQWDGYRVFQDPTYAAVAAVAGSGSNPAVPTITESPAQTSITAAAGTIVQLSWKAVDADPTSWQLLDESNNVVSSGTWTSGVSVTVNVVVQLGTHSYTMKFFDAQGNSITSSPITITGTPAPTTTTSGSGPPSTSIITIGTSTVQSSNSGIPGFTLDMLFLVLVVSTPLVLYRKRKNNF